MPTDRGRELTKLGKVYRDFWLWVVKLTDRKAEDMGRQDIQVKDVTHTDGYITFRIWSSRPLLINGLSARRRDTERADYDVAIDFEQHVSIKADGDGMSYFEAVRSTIRLLYLENYNSVKTKGTSGKIYSGVHFDLNDQNQNTSDEYDHAIFHANFDLKCIDPRERLGRVNYEEPAIGRIDSPRIPTAPMDISAVVFSLLRDHMPETVVKGWPENMLEVLNDLPHLPKGTLNDCLKPEAHSNCYCWYRLDGRRN